MKHNPLNRCRTIVCLFAMLLPSLITNAQGEQRTDDQPNNWDAFVQQAGDAFGDQGTIAAEFLRDHRPPRDARLTTEFLMENLTLAFQARNEFPWASDIPFDLFLNDVLPYAVADETREAWRPDMLKRARTIVADATTATQAAQALNQHLFNAINVHYNTGRKKPNQSPAESIAQGRATCTGLSIILVDACRAVGIPARAAGVAEWNGKQGNHTWVEIWDGTWMFTGADEYNANGMNRAWFVNDARKAIAGHPTHAVRATAWSHDNGSFPMAWNMADTTVGGVDVTHRYLGTSPGDPGTGIAHFRTWNTKDGTRIEANITVRNPEGDAVAQCTTKAGRHDLNDMPAATLSLNTRYTLDVQWNDNVRTHHVSIDNQDNNTIDLHWSALGLTRADAEQRLAQIAEQRAAAAQTNARRMLEEKAIVVGDHTLKILERSFGDAPEGQRSLWISMHGGGGAPERVNDQQWENQIRLYQPEEGFYVAPRAPTNTWNLWHQRHIDGLFDALIEAYVITRGVNPNRIYLMGYSAGGDGVYQLAPRMADRFAAAAMMAGHPNEAQPLGLRNLPFAIFMGGKDSAYNRNTIAQSWGDRIASLQAEDPSGYDHRVTIYPECGHWMNGQDKEALPWMATKTRNPWPTRIVWHQDDVTHNRFYWIALPDDQVAKGTTIRASVDGQTIAIDTDDVSALTLHLRDALIDLDKPVTVLVNGTTVHNAVVPRTEHAIETTISQRLDPTSAATAVLPLSWNADTP